MSKTIFIGIVSVLAVVMVFSNALPGMIYATNNGNSDCGDRGFSPGCSPGQHVNDNGKSTKNVGNPHYPQVGGDKTGDPHGELSCTPNKGNPHATYPC